MRKITILEVWDPIQEVYIPLKQAIIQGLFDTSTYLFFNPKENQHYSITEAAQRFFFKSVIDLRPESLIVERVKIAQTVALVSARDPFTNKIIDIVDAISCGVVDTNFRIYRFLNKNESVGLNEAIDRDLVQIKVIKEITEHITETLTEEKSTSLNNFGLIKKIETSSSQNLNTGENKSNSGVAHQQEDTRSVHQTPEGLFTFNRTKSVNVSKRIKKSDEEFAAGFISESDSKKIINQTSKRLKSVLKSGAHSLSPVIDLNEAIRNNIVILPDSLILKQNVKYVIDLKSNLHLDYEVACDLNIIDVASRTYLDTITNKKLNLFEALKKNYIVMREELYTNYEDTFMLYDNIDEATHTQLKLKKQQQQQQQEQQQLRKKSVSLSSFTSLSDSSFNRGNTPQLTSKDIVTLFNPHTGEQVPVWEAIELGLYDKKTNEYVLDPTDATTNPKMKISEAAEKGMAVLRSDKLLNQINEGYQFLHITGIINPLTKKEMKLNEAIESGILDYAQGEYHDPDSGRTLTLLEAYDKGYLITSVRSYTPPVPQSISQLQKPNEQNNHTLTKPIETPKLKSKKQHLIETNTKENLKIKKSLSCLDKSNRRDSITDSVYNKQKQQQPQQLIKTEHPGNLEAKPPSYVKSHSQSPFRPSRDKRNGSVSSERTSLRGKSFDRFSFSSRSSSIISKFREKLFSSNKKIKNIQFDESLILDSIRIADRLTGTKYDLRTAIDLDLAVSDDQIKDTLDEKCVSIRDAIRRDLITFVSPMNPELEYSFSQNIYIYDNSLYLFNYVLNPNDQRKMRLSEAFEKLILDGENPIYFGKRGPYSLESAMQKGYVSCECIDLNLLNNIITSNIFKYSHTVNNDTIDLHYVNVNDTSQHSTPNPIVPLPLPPQQSSNIDQTSAPELKNCSPHHYYYEEDKQEDESIELPKALKEKIKPKELIPLYNEKGYLSKAILQESGVKFSERKNYVITDIYDEEKNVYLVVKDAARLGIFNEDTQEYVNSATGDVMHVSVAIRTNKIKIANIKKLTDKQFNRLFDQEINEFNKVMSQQNKNFQSSIKNHTNNSREETLAESIESNHFNSNENSLHQNNSDESTQNYAKIIDPPLTLKSTSLEQSKQLNTTVTSYPLDENNDITSNTNNNNIITTNPAQQLESITNITSISNFDLIQCLLYKKPTNGKYIRFDRVIKNRLYDYDTKLIKDLKTDEYVSINESLHRGVLRINDSTILVDKQCVYKIESVTFAEQNYSLAECLKKKMISRKECILRHPKRIYSIMDAIREGVIDGKIITSDEMQSVIDDYYLKYEENRKISKKPNIELVNVQETTQTFIIPHEVTTTSDFYNSSTIESNLNKNTNEFYIFDFESEYYISINDAFSRGILITEPIRIKDPSTKSFISLRDAIVKGLVSCEKSKKKVPFKDRSSFYTINRVSYIIDGIYDPQRINCYSLQEAVKLDLFKNGMYVFSKNLSHKIDDAINMHLILGRQIEIDKIDMFISEVLSVPPVKPMRGIFVETSRKNSDDSVSSRNKRTHNNTNKTDDYYSIGRGSTLRTPDSDNGRMGKIELIKDVKNGTYLSLDEALEAKIINFNKGLFINTLTTNTVDISTAIERGFIIMDYQAANFVNRPSFETRSRSLSQRSKKTIRPTDHFYTPIDDTNDTEIIKVGRQFIITAVLDPVNRLQLDLEDAIKVGLFDIECAMYNDPRANKKLTLVDAIDQGLIKIADESFQASYKLTIEENDKRYYKHLKTYSIRYIVHPVTKQIVPLNVAVDKNLVNLDNGSYFGYEKVITLKEAYEKCLALTVDDLDQPESKRNKYRVAFVRKSTTGKNMSLKSALAKNWLNFGRRIYIDKQTNQEIPFSQAIDMDLLVLLGHFEEKPTNDTLKAKSISARLARKSVDSSSESFGNSLSVSGLTKRHAENSSNR